jgi:hypothetical protein
MPHPPPPRSGGSGSSGSDGSNGVGTDRGRRNDLSASSSQA